MIKFDPHEGNGIPASLQMFAPNADWHQRLTDDYPDDEEEEDHADAYDNAYDNAFEEEEDNADAYDEKDGVVDAEWHPRGFADQNDDNADDDVDDDAANDVLQLY